MYSGIPPPPSILFLKLVLELEPRAPQKLGSTLSRSCTEALLGVRQRSGPCSAQEVDLITDRVEETVSKAHEEGTQHLGTGDWKLYEMTDSHMSGINFCKLLDIKCWETCSFFPSTKLYVSTYTQNNARHCSDLCPCCWWPLQAKTLQVVSFVPNIQGYSSLSGKV